MPKKGSSAHLAYPISLEELVLQRFEAPKADGATDGHLGCP